MSLHFDVCFACDLKPETPDQVIKTLEYMTRSEDYDFDTPPKHHFFDYEKAWRNYLQLKPNHDYAAGGEYSHFSRAYRYTKGSEGVYRYTLSWRKGMHEDVTWSEMLWQFLFWIAPYSETEGYVGYYKEELGLHPTLLYFKKGQLYLLKVEGMPDGPPESPWDDV